MRILRGLFAALMVSSFAGAAHAGVVSALSGQASAITAEGFEGIDVGTQLQPGSRVLVSEGSTVTITFSPDCEITVHHGETYRIPEDPRCEAAPHEETGPAQVSQLGFETIAIGLAGVGLVTGIVIMAAQSGGGDDTPPASP